jgi:hypothetical protein
MNAITLQDGTTITLKPKYSPNLRKQVQKIFTDATGTGNVDTMYLAIDVFIGSITKPKDDGSLETLQLSALLDLAYDEYMQVVNAIMEFIKHDKGMYDAIGKSFNLIELTAEEKALVQKKMEAKS